MWRGLSPLWIEAGEASGSFIQNSCEEQHRRIFLQESGAMVKNDVDDNS